MSLRPSTIEEARAQFKPMSRSRIKRGKPLSRAVKPKKKKKVKISSLKKRAWTEFSIYIRTRHAEPDGYVFCVTCGVRKHWKTVDAGHFIAGRLNSNLFDERGCHAQCKNCNGPKAGNGPRYYQFMLKTYGQEVIDELLSQNDQTHKWLPGELESIARKYAEINSRHPLNSS